MTFWSRLFGPPKVDPALKQAVEHIRRVLDDESFQNELLAPSLQAVIRNQPAIDRDPDGEGPFGFSEANAIPVNGPIGELAYLSRLETPQGERLLFHRLGAIDGIDVFEAVTFSGSEWYIFYLDFYHPRRSRALPDGFRFTSEVPQFAGFENFCANFPYDFVEKKEGLPGGLRLAYIAPSRILSLIRGRGFVRPPEHVAELESVSDRLTSSKPQ